jgi:hypothetical protein
MLDAHTNTHIQKHKRRTPRQRGMAIISYMRTGNMRRAEWKPSPSTEVSACTTRMVPKEATSTTAPCMRTASNGGSSLKSKSSIGRNSLCCSLRTFFDKLLEHSFAAAFTAARKSTQRSENFSYKKFSDNKHTNLPIHLILIQEQLKAGWQGLQQRLHCCLPRFQGGLRFAPPLPPKEMPPFSQMKL